MNTPRQVVDRLLEGRPRGPLPPGASAEAFAPANIALVKYWGKRDESLNLPMTSSLSISLGELGTTTRIAPAEKDAFRLNGRELEDNDPAALRIKSYLDLFRDPSVRGFQVETANSIPTAAGLASSASGFAALAMALDRLFGWALEPRVLSVLARLGSGSACRSVYEGFVEWRGGTAADGLDSHAVPLDDRWPELLVGLLVVNAEPKPIPSRTAMRRTMATSPLYRAWPGAVESDIAILKEAIAQKDFELLGATAEGNAMTMHATMLAARPAVCYWTSASLEAMADVRRARSEGLTVFYTMDAGPNLKLLLRTRDREEVGRRFPGLRIVRPFADG